MVNAIGFCGAAYSQIIVFRDETDFKKILAANPHMEAIIGGSDADLETLPGVYIAGIKSSLHLDSSEDSLSSIQK